MGHHRHQQLGSRRWIVNSDSSSRMRRRAAAAQHGVELGCEGLCAGNVDLGGPLDHPLGRPLPSLVAASDSVTASQGPGIPLL